MKIYIEIEHHALWVNQFKPDLMEDSSSFHYGTDECGECFCLNTEADKIRDFIVNNFKPIAIATRSKLYELEV